MTLLPEAMKCDYSNQVGKWLRGTNGACWVWGTTTKNILASSQSLQFHGDVLPRATVTPAGRLDYDVIFRMKALGSIFLCHTGMQTHLWSYIRAMERWIWFSVVQWECWGFPGCCLCIELDRICESFRYGSKKVVWTLRMLTTLLKRIFQRLEEPWKPDGGGL